MSQYISETNCIISGSDLKNIRTLYLPIIGHKASALYHSLIDEVQVNKYKVDYRSEKSLLSSLQLSKTEMLESRKKLEAVGLIKTFKKNDEDVTLFSIHQPLNIEGFKKNLILWDKLKKEIGEIELERLVFENKSETIQKNSFTDISAKYFDVFEVEEKEKIQTTAEISAPKFDNKSDAVKSLSAELFTRFISNVAPTPTLLNLFNDLRNKGFSNTSINLMQDYSFAINKKVVAKHIETIATDFMLKQIDSSNDIQSELSNALEKRTETNGKSINKNNFIEEGEINLDEVFSDLFS